MTRQAADTTTRRPKIKDGKTSSTVHAVSLVVNSGNETGQMITSQQEPLMSGHQRGYRGHGGIWSSVIGRQIAHVNLTSSGCVEIVGTLQPPPQPPHAGRQHSHPTDNGSHEIIGKTFFTTLDLHFPSRRRPINTDNSGQRYLRPDYRASSRILFPVKGQSLKRLQLPVVNKYHAVTDLTKRYFWKRITDGRVFRKWTQNQTCEYLVFYDYHPVRDLTKRYFRERITDGRVFRKWTQNQTCGDFVFYDYHSVRDLRQSEVSTTSGLRSRKLAIRYQAANWTQVMNNLVFAGSPRVSIMPTLASRFQLPALVCSAKYCVTAAKKQTENPEKEYTELKNAAGVSQARFVNTGQPQTKTQGRER
ncbi:hypothetical protein BaRGS_00025480 [Batillaria attramentaria]|uniref:Uncharacterized protein n=1 Tax=Batillaria attramentaria TaxID=370345 RepID=A0ABD0K8A9_9CAEN